VTRSALSRFLSVPVLLVAMIGSAACGTSAPAEPEPAAATAHDGHSGGHGGGDAGGPSGGPSAGHGGGHGGHGSGGVPAPTLYAVQTGPLGIILTDGSGHLLYRSDADRADPPTSSCTDECAQTWIPVTAPPDQELDLAGVKQELVGRLQRPDGSSQLTLAGWPLYRNRDDDGSLATAGQNGADGSWFVVTPKGEKATAA
jgi:predicted lipoprotein with Yx(FWY)xxD motif